MTHLIRLGTAEGLSDALTELHFKNEAKGVPPHIRRDREAVARAAGRWGMVVTYDNLDFVTEQGEADRFVTSDEGTIFLYHGLFRYPDSFELDTGERNLSPYEAAIFKGVI